VQFGHLWDAPRPGHSTVRHVTPIGSRGASARSRPTVDADIGS
jgi:hypothetical protein